MASLSSWVGKRVWWPSRWHEDTQSPVTYSGLVVGVSVADKDGHKCYAFVEQHGWRSARPVRVDRLRLDFRHPIGRAA